MVSQEREEISLIIRLIIFQYVCAVSECMHSFCAVGISILVLVTVVSANSFVFVTAMVCLLILFFVTAMVCLLIFFFTHQANQSVYSFLRNYPADLNTKYYYVNVSLMPNVLPMHVHTLWVAVIFAVPWMPATASRHVYSVY